MTRPFVLDVSKHQGTIDWDKVNGHCNGVIIRCGYGDDLPAQDDKQFARNVEECVRLGIPFGIYFYSYSECDTQTDSEIAHTLRLCVPYKDKLSFPLYLDLEQDGTQNGVVERAKVWLERMKAEGFTVGVYANEYWFHNYIKDGLDGYTKWVAKYGKNNGLKDVEPVVDGMDAWQFTSCGVIDGIVGRVDISEFYRDFPNEMHPTTVQPDGASVPSVTPTPTPEQVKKWHELANVTYRVYTDRWWPPIVNKNGWAGQGDNKGIINLAIGVDWGSVRYQVHTTDGRLHAIVTGNDIRDFNNGFAGDNKHKIDYIAAEFLTPEGYVYQVLVFRVSTVGDANYLPEQVDMMTTNGMDGYGGIIGREIDKLQMWTEYLNK